LFKAQKTRQVFLFVDVVGRRAPPHGIEVEGPSPLGLPFESRRTFSLSVLEEGRGERELERDSFYQNHTDTFVLAKKFSESSQEMALGGPAFSCTGQGSGVLPFRK